MVEASADVSISIIVDMDFFLASHTILFTNGSTSLVPF